MIFGIFCSQWLAFDLSFFIPNVLAEEKALVQDADAKSLKDYTNFMIRWLRSTEVLNSTNFPAHWSANLLKATGS